MNEFKPKNQEEKRHELEQKDLWKQLSNAITFQSNSNDVMWRVFTMFFPGNAGLLVALFASEYPPRPALGIIICIAGVFFSVVWHRLQARGQAHTERFEALIARIENELNFNRLFATSREVNTADAKKYVSKPGVARQLMSLCAWMGISLWSVGLLIFLFYQYCSCSMPTYMR